MKTVSNHKIIAALFLSGFSLLLFAQNPDCSKVKTGNFKIFNPGIGLVEITRTKKTQTEVSKVDGYKGKFKVRWIDECTYVLYDKKTIRKGNNQKDVSTGDVICKIIEVGDTYYKVAVSSTFSKQTFEMKIDFND